jgi:hypothetical protein
MNVVPRVSSGEMNSEVQINKKVADEAADVHGQVAAAAKERFSQELSADSSAGLNENSLVGLVVNPPGGEKVKGVVKTNHPLGTPLLAPDMEVDISPQTSSFDWASRFKAIDDKLIASKDSTQNQFNSALESIKELVNDNQLGNIDWSKIEIKAKPSTDSPPHGIQSIGGENRFKISCTYIIEVPIGPDGNQKIQSFELQRDVFTSGVDQDNVLMVVMKYAEVVSQLALGEYNETKNLNLKLTLPTEDVDRKSLMNERLFVFEFDRTKQGEGVSLKSITPGGKNNTHLSISFINQSDYKLPPEKWWLKSEDTSKQLEKPAESGSTVSVGTVMDPEEPISTISVALASENVSKTSLETYLNQLLEMNDSGNIKEDLSREHGLLLEEILRRLTSQGDDKTISTGVKQFNDVQTSREWAKSFKGDIKAWCDQQEQHVQQVVAELNEDLKDQGKLAAIRSDILSIKSKVEALLDKQDPVITDQDQENLVKFKENILLQQGQVAEFINKSIFTKAERIVLGVEGSLANCAPEELLKNHLKLIKNLREGLRGLIHVVDREGNKTYTNLKERYELHLNRLLRPLLDKKDPDSHNKGLTVGEVEYIQSFPPDAGLDIRGESLLDREALNVNLIALEQANPGLMRILGQNGADVSMESLIRDVGSFLAQNKKKLDYITVPILSKGHWVSFFIDIKGKRIEYYDPIKSFFADSLVNEKLKGLQDFLNHEFSDKFTAEKMIKKRIQMDGHQCGPWVCVLLENRLSGEPKIPSMDLSKDNNLGLLQERVQAKRMEIQKGLIAQRAKRLGE